jgi:hypothetical protein
VHNDNFLPVAIFTFMTVTVCELDDNECKFIDDWNGLEIHLDQNKTDSLLPEMPSVNGLLSEKRSPTDPK